MALKRLRFRDRLLWQYLNYQTDEELEEFERLVLFAVQQVQAQRWASETQRAVMARWQLRRWQFKSQ